MASMFNSKYNSVYLLDDLYHLPWSSTSEDDFFKEINCEFCYSVETAPSLQPLILENTSSSLSTLPSLLMTVLCI